ncbi:MAG: DUF1553 domain-containing protein [Planctomycetota bacterium]|nr:DUF1553 domain-containing protein [Planctomycetota bacterium]
MTFEARTRIQIAAYFVVGMSAHVFADDMPAAGDVDYVRDIKPIFKTHCFSCHGALKQQSGLRLDTGRSMLKGGESGPAIVRKNVAGSLLVSRITAADATLRMPPEGTPLSPDEIRLIRAWITSGATSPADEQSEPDPRDHWSFRKPVRPAIPTPINKVWGHNPIDAFVAAEHERHGLTPLPTARKEILLRRVTLDLIGLPPTREELHAFLNDTTPNAYEKVVDRLLGNRHYGERWGRHWMDVWRYSDWYGRRQVNDVRNSYPHIWRWRDWIIQSLNEDKGYDQMLREMLAADELYPDDDSRMPALGFIIRNWFSLNYDTWKQDLVEHTGKAFLGLRLNCAHCHDHKYDPISQREYFQFRAFFEPLELRHDRVPNGPKLAKYIRYRPSSGGSLGPIKAGLPRVYDHFVDDKTFMYRLGDTRDRMDRPPVQPAGLAILGGDKLKIQEVRLPPVAWYPGLKAFAQQAEIDQRRQAVKSAKAARAKVEPGMPSAAAEADLVAASTELQAVEARVAADRARFGQSEGNAEELAKHAAHAVRAAKLASGRAKLAHAEKTLAEQKVAAKPDAKVIKQAEQDAVAARKAIALHEEQSSDADGTYEPFGPQYPKTSTGRRRALAGWIANPENPLTARVAVNHIWMRHFGQPLVESVFDFGRSGKQPTHPRLLDWLAVELMEQRSATANASTQSSDTQSRAWNMKHLHRLIVTSRTYQLSSRPGLDHANLKRDKNNTYMWKFNRRRLESEIIRDSLLHVSGQLDQTIGGQDLDPKLEATSHRRSMYFSVYPEGGGMMRFMSLFDAPDPCDCYRRSETIVPQQALAMSNSTLSLSVSRQLAKTTAVATKQTEEQFVIAAFEKILCRSPSTAETRACLEFLTDKRAREGLVRVLLNHNDFVTIH